MKIQTAPTNNTSTTPHRRSGLFASYTRILDMLYSKCLKVDLLGIFHSFCRIKQAIVIILTGRLHFCTKLHNSYKREEG
jgi:hypothetical protein